MLLSLQDAGPGSIQYLFGTYARVVFMQYYASPRMSRRFHLSSMPKMKGKRKDGCLTHVDAHTHFPKESTSRLRFKLIALLVAIGNLFALDPLELLRNVITHMFVRLGLFALASRIIIG